jgi:hypothetical protein
MGISEDSGASKDAWSVMAVAASFMTARFFIALVSDTGHSFK